MASRLDDVDLSLKISREEEAERLAQAGRRMMQLRLVMAGLLEDGAGRKSLGPPLCVVMEGWDASGKGGAIKRLVGPLDPRHVRVATFGAPSFDEKRHHFLHRFWPALPGWGGMAVLDRSWYGRVLVERVEHLTSEKHWRRAYDEINAFERTLRDEGMVLVKIWIHISDEEQLKRFERRQEDPLKSWKLTPDDWRNRGLRPMYLEAVDEMLQRCDTEAAPWHVIPGESKRLARVAVLETVIAMAEDGLRRHGMEPPPPLTEDPS
ncbi:MAG TPA: UDP-galactose-lipid carrier transferase [Casimicrobiaceae bacterium]